MRGVQGGPSVARMPRRDNTHHAPVIAAYSPQTDARGPVEFGLAASRITGAPLVVVAVVDTGSLNVHFGAEEAQSHETPSGIAQTLRHLEQELNKEGVFAEVRGIEDSTAARGLARTIDELEPELIVIGATTRGAKGSMLLGTTAERVIHVSACPVAVVPHSYQRPEGGVKRIGAAYMDTPEGEEALSAAARLARVGGVSLRAITILDPKYAQEDAHGLMAEQHREVGAESGSAARVRAETEAKLRERLAALAGGLDAELDVMTDEATAGLIAASGQVDLLVMGSRGLGPRRSVVLGSVSRRVIERSACPVLVIPRGAAEGSDTLLTDAEAHAPRPA
jgi:nucleotide-binding universal stress UspA family protein